LENKGFRQMRSIAATIIIPAATVALSACAVPPPAGPTVMALPGQGKDFAAFQQDDMTCRQYAWAQTGGASPGVAASQSAVGTAVAGTALGAAAGAAIGAASGAAGPGAAIGAATGLIAGTAIGANNASATYGSVQQAYDVSYSQCMVAHGDSIQAPPVNYAGGYPYPYAYPYPAYPYGYPSGFYAPSIAFGFGWGGGWGWGWGHRGWRGGWYH
jgi:OmpA family protein